MKIVILFILSVIGIQCKCQSHLSFTPSVGLQRCFASYVDGDNSAIFKNNTPNQQIQIGLLIGYHKNKFEFSTGYIYDHVGYAYRLKDDSSVQKDSNFISYSHSSAMRTFSIPLKVSFKVKEINFIKTKSKLPASLNRDSNELSRDTHFINCLLKINGAIIYNHVPERPFGQAYFSNNQVSTISTYNTIHKNGISISLGFSIQFLRRGKEFIGLNFYYTQGFTKYESIQINYTRLATNQSYEENLVTRGTNCGISISYPIKIITFHKR